MQTLPRRFNRRAFSMLAAATLMAPMIRPASAQAIDDLEQALNDLDQLHSIQVQVGSEVLFAQAPHGAGLAGAANIKSCSKSIVALLLGTCIERGEIGSVHRTLAEVAPSLIPPDASDDVASITMEDLVTLAAGLQGTSGADYGSWVSSSNWVADALSRPMIAAPGSRMIYSTGTTHVLGAALVEASGISLLELARQRLGDPLGFDVAPWITDPQGYYLGGNEMSLTPQSMLRVALLMRDEGRFGGEQVIAADWIRESTVPRVRSPYSGMQYGYGWFITESGFVLARGYGGQIIAAHRGANLAVAITSDPNRPATSDGYFGALTNLLSGPVLALARRS